MNEITRLTRAAGYALDGLVYMVKEEKNTRLLLVIAALVWLICPLVGFSAFQTAMVFFAVMVTVAAEVLNTAIEIALDLHTQGKYNPKVKIAKDAAACAVLFCIVTSVVLTVVIFISNLLAK